jgi:hypothetical protein
MLYTYTSVGRIFATLTREKFSFEEDSVIEWIGDALDFIGTPRMLEPAIAFAEVKNNQCPVPQYAHTIGQIARYRDWNPDCAPSCTPQAIIQEAPNIFYQNCSTCGNQPTGQDMGYVVLDGKGSPVVEYDLAYYRPYCDLLGEYYGWSNTQAYLSNYTPVRLATGSFFDTILDPNYDRSLYNNCKDEYRVIQGKTLRFSFSTGFVCIGFDRSVRDPQTGYPMIPDTISHITAIVSYIKKKKIEIDFVNKREGSVQLLQYFDDQWQWYCGQASNLDKMPQGIDEHQNIYDQRNYLLPDWSKYYSYFGNLAKPEYRKYNDPDWRNNRTTFVTSHP